MTIPTLASLIPVDVKTVWPLEASSFTPWLLANSATLGEELGLDLHLHSAEHKVGLFSLDLIGVDVDTDDVVIIENQFGTTDHRHLGQLLTYAGGTSPAIIVWIAETFRDEHRAALDWLNQRTDANTKFFGVEVSAVTLTGAPAELVAPRFEVVVKPNDWGKEVKAATSVSATARELLYQDFWTQWLAAVAPHKWTARQAPARHWMHLPAGSAKARFSVSFRTDGLLSELFLNHPDSDVNLARWKDLVSRKQEIEESFGGPLVFDDLPTRKGCRIGVFRSDGESVDDVELWSEYSEWFEQTQISLRKAIAVTGGIPPIPGQPGVEDDDSEA